MGMCSAIVPGMRGECQRPVVEDAPLRLCLLHALLAWTWVQRLGSDKVVAAIKEQGNH